MSPAYDIPKAAPAGPLGLVQQFVNSADRENGVEWLDGGWFAEHGLPGQEDLEAARAVREALRSLLLANNGRPLDPEALPALNRASERIGLGVRFESRSRAVLAPPADRPLASILVAVYTAMAGGEWTRLKACRHCRWAFYDYSRNRSATWCSMRLCGNRSKTRAYRIKHRT